MIEDQSLLKATRREQWRAGCVVEVFGPSRQWCVGWIATFQGYQIEKTRCPGHDLAQRKKAPAQRRLVCCSRPMSLDAGWAVWQALLPRPVPSAPSDTRYLFFSRHCSKGNLKNSGSLRSPWILAAAAAWRSRSRSRGGNAAAPSGLELDFSADISERPEKRVVPELSRYEDPDDPVRPAAPLRDRAGLWAPPSPEAIGAPEVLVVGLGRRLRSCGMDGPRARLGAGALEALQRRYQISSYFDADAQ
eukprot:symbB.v1.2.021639.t1/scaffold1828.1/size99598/1